MSMYTYDIGLTVNEIAALFFTLEDVSVVEQQQEEELRHEKDRLILVMEEESYLDDKLDVDVDLVDEMTTNFHNCDLQDHNDAVFEVYQDVPYDHDYASYSNKTAYLFNQNLFNPLVAPHVQIYLEDIGRRPISEIWVISQLWIQQGGTIHADCFHVEQLGLVDKAPLVQVLAHKKLRLPISNFAATHSDIAIQLGEVLFDEDSCTFAGKILNWIHQIDQGDDLFTIWMPLWADDVSGAHTKQYQKYINVYSQNANLPGTLLQQEFFEILEKLLAWLASQTSQLYNALLDIPFVDPSQDTLVEILHTILLSVEKYAWHSLHSGWTPLQQKLFTICLQSTDISGLQVPPICIEYMMQYCNALIEKHFKTLIQTTIFQLHNIVTVDQLTLIRALGKLGPVLWMFTIDDINEYLGDLQLCIDNVLDTFANLDPAKILIKIKLHALVHLPQQIHCREPAV
ncbi:uncharacterized protein ARMOST_00573 [Armillaria ostoyae]|uniref:Uncharacterized protein n=1 Tax=Armillaria ostoyae TaxID=47428 RepID=A0A284QLH8_ARMOS|nr:uncharacterized protein ARMOST_00573 [Armillaria ostoyae]